MSEWIIFVEFPIVNRRCGVVECDTEEQAVAVSIAYRDKIIAEDVIPSAIVTVRRHSAEEHGAAIKALAGPPETPPAAPPKATTTKRKS